MLPKMSHKSATDAHNNVTINQPQVTTLGFTGTALKKKKKLSLFLNINYDRKQIEGNFETYTSGSGLLVAAAKLVSSC